MRLPTPELSVVIPVFNESANIGPLCERLVPVLERVAASWEIVFVDDGSEDDTLAAIRAAQRRASRGSARSRSAATSARRSRSRPASTTRAGAPS